MSARDALRDTASVGRGSQNGSEPSGVMFDAKGKLLLPEAPPNDQLEALCNWLTVVLNLNPKHPVSAAVREGLRGPDGHVVLRRVDAPSIRFEPASRINNPARCIEAICWQALPTDGAIHAFKAEHCREISYVIRMLCGASKAMRDEQEADAIVGELMHVAVAIEGHTTYGTTSQRYEAAIALRREGDPTTGRPIGPARYLIDENTGELVIAVSDLAEAARRHIGSSLPRGWLDARIENLGWTRISLQGYGLPGRSGRQGPHARINAYRGQLLADSGDQDVDHDQGAQPVNT